MDNNNNHILNNRAFPQNGLFNKYKEFISTFGLNQLIRVPSRVTSNTSSLLDHVLTNAYDKITHYGSLEISLSDHQPIFCTRKVTRFRPGTKEFKRSLNYENFDNVNLAFVDFST